jgi:hypothetical protein
MDVDRGSFRDRVRGMACGADGRSGGGVGTYEPVGQAGHFGSI